MPLGPEIIAATCPGRFPQNAQVMSSSDSKPSILSLAIACYSLFSSEEPAREVVMRSTRPYATASSAVIHLSRSQSACSCSGVLPQC